MVPVEFLRSLSNQYLPDTCAIQRYTETVTGDGTGQSWSDHLTGVACRVSPRGRAATESLGADQSLQAVADWTVWMPALQDVTPKDRVVVGTRTFEVVVVTARSYEAVRAVLCREIV